MKKLYALIAILCITYNLSSQVGCSLTGSTGCGSSPQYAIGTGTAVNNQWAFPSVYGNYYKNSRHQLLYTASELISSGMVPGNISSVSFIIDSIVSGYVGTLPGLTISLKCVSQTSLASAFDNVGLTQVYSSSYTPVDGINTHAFITSYVWDGVSDLLVDMCYTYVPTSIYTNNPMMPATTTSVFRCVYAQDDTTPLCGASASWVTQTYERANIMFGNCLIITSLDSKTEVLTGIDIFPNPSTGIFTIKSQVEKFEVSIINTIGQVIKTQEVKNSSQTTIDMSTMSKGIYYAKVSSSEGTKLFKLILE